VTWGTANAAPVIEMPDRADAPAMNAGVGSVPIARRGYTLVELLAAIVVLGILGAIAVPRFFRVSDAAYLAVAKQVEVDLKYERDDYFRLYKSIPEAFTDLMSWANVNPWNNGRERLSYPQPFRDRYFQNPAAYIGIDFTHIRMTFKNGLVANYYIDPATGSISATYAGP
jgi:prepilin-type N-terminal cleavage/methylation domain-containing protein